MAHSDVPVFAHSHVGFSRFVRPSFVQARTVISGNAAATPDVIKHRPCTETSTYLSFHSTLLLVKTPNVEVKAEGRTSWAEAAGHALAHAHLAALVVSAGVRTGAAALAVLHVEGATAVVSAQRRAPPGPQPPASASALERVLGDGGTQAAGAGAAAAARVLDAHLHKGVHVQQVLAVGDGRLQQKLLTALSLRADI